jgi:methanogenic corrinoid protein MtbC1
MATLHQEVSAAIEARLAALADALVTLHYDRQPALAERYGPQGRQHCRDDARTHLASLAQALAVACPSLFTEYVAWAQVLLTSRGLPPDDLVTHFHYLRTVVQQQLPAAMQPLAGEYIAAGLAQLRAVPPIPSPLPSAEEGLAGVAHRYLTALLQGQSQHATQLIQEALRAGARIPDLYLQVFAPTQYELGRLWQLNQLSVAQEHYCTAVTQRLMASLYPAIVGPPHGRATLIVACVAGELHELGARMVADLLELDGWHTVYVGASTPPAGLVQLLEERQAQVLCLSATLALHAGAVRAIIEAVRAAPIGQRVHILVGGRLFQTAPDLWRQLGADATARDASEAVVVARPLRQDKKERLP